MRQGKNAFEQSPCSFFHVEVAQASRSSSTKDKTTCRLTLSSMASQCPIHAFCKLFLNSEAWLQAQMHFFASDTSSFWQPASYGMYSISINSGLHSVWNIYLSMFFYCYCIVVVYQECWQCCIVKVTHKEKIHKLRGRVKCKKHGHIHGNDWKTLELRLDPLKNGHWC